MSTKKYDPAAFCSLSLSELSLLIRGRKLVGSRRKVISSDFKNLFIPVNKPSGLHISITVYTSISGDSRSSPSLDGGRTVEDDDSVGQICSHDEIVLDDECGSLRAHDELLDNLTCDNTLLRVEVCRRLIDQEDIGRNTQHKGNGNTLQLSSRQTGQSVPVITRYSRLDILINNVLDVEGFQDVAVELRVHVHSLDSLQQQRSDGSGEFG